MLNMTLFVNQCNRTISQQQWCSDDSIRVGRFTTDDQSTAEFEE